jgi:hypothetical protein
MVCMECEGHMPNIHLQPDGWTALCVKCCACGGEDQYE